MIGISEGSVLRYHRLMATAAMFSMMNRQQFGYRDTGHMSPSDFRALEFRRKNRKQNVKRQKRRR